VVERTNRVTNPGTIVIKLDNTPSRDAIVMHTRRLVIITTLVAPAHGSRILSRISCAPIGTAPGSILQALYKLDNAKNTSGKYITAYKKADTGASNKAE